MRLFRLALVAVLIIVLGVAVHQTLVWLGLWGGAGESQVKSLDDTDQEIALIEPATSNDDWVRLVAAVKLLESEWGHINGSQTPLTASLEHAFPPLTVEVPEIVLSFNDDRDHKLRLRWYKISGEHDALSWVRKLKARARPPLAIIGGATSDRAVRLARALQRTYPEPNEPSPVFLVTTATAEKTASGTPLTGVYAGRSFRFSFTNQKMVAALLEFVQHREYPPQAEEWGAGNLWAQKPGEQDSAPRAIVGFLHGLPMLTPYTMHTVSWADERYSIDMSDLFQEEFKKRFPLGEFPPGSSIASGVGGFFHPGPMEQATVNTFLTRPIAPQSFLVLPTSTVRMRRFLIHLNQRSPRDARNLVILNGDAITFHSIYRDRDVMWNVLDLPYSLVFFAHRNPIGRAAGFRGPGDKRDDDEVAFPPRGASGTHDLLLYRDLLEAFLYAARERGKWVGDPLTVRDRLRATSWYHPPFEKMKDDPPRVCNPEIHPLDAHHRRFFDEDGNRQSRTGEHIVWLKPSFTDDRVDLKSTISVWTLRPRGNDAVWYLADDAYFSAFYNQSRLEGGQ